MTTEEILPDCRDLEQEGFGGHPLNAKPLRGFGSAGVLEIVDDYNTDTYRAVYTVRFAGVVYVLHAFQKKAKQGRETPKREMDLIRARYKAAEQHYHQHGSST
jgi:phage-related protein